MSVSESGGVSVCPALRRRCVNVVLVFGHWKNKNVNINIEGTATPEFRRPPKRVRISVVVRMPGMPAETAQQLDIHQINQSPSTAGLIHADGL